MDVNAKRKVFMETLKGHYDNLFVTDPTYAFSVQRCKPEWLAEKMVNSLIANTASKDGNGIKWTCRDLKIPYTYKAIREYLGV